MQVKHLRTSITDLGNLCIHVEGFDAFNEPIGDKTEMLFIPPRFANELLNIAQVWYLMQGERADE